MKKILGLSVAAALATTVAMAGTLDDVKKAGVLKCGVSTGLPGFAEADSKGTWRGLDVDFCRAVAAAVVGDAKKVKYVPLNAKERFTALQSGEIDVLARNTTWTNTRDTTLGLNFVGVNYYDGYKIKLNITNVTLEELISVDDDLLIDDFLNPNIYKERQEK